MNLTEANNRHCEPCKSNISAGIILQTLRLSLVLTSIVITVKLIVELVSTSGETLRSAE